MTARTAAENRLLLDATQVAISVGTLTLTWWVVFDKDGGDDHLTSGWGGLDTGRYGQGWLLIIGVVLALSAVAVDARVGHIIAAVVAGMGSILLLVALLDVDHFSGYDSASGPWVGFALLLAPTTTQALASSGRE